MSFVAQLYTVCVRSFSETVCIDDLDYSGPLAKFITFFGFFVGLEFKGARVNGALIVRNTSRRHNIVLVHTLLVTNLHDT